MCKGQQGFHLVLVPLGIIIVGVLGFAAWRVIQHTKNAGSSSIHQGNGPHYDALAACGSGPAFTTSPIDLGALDSIAPLGAINPPDHTIPTDHMYFMYRYERPDTERYDLVAPANSVVTSLTYSGKVAGQQSEDTDYSITLSPCKGVAVKLAHVNSLEGALKNVIGANGEGAKCRHDKPAEGEELLFCNKDVDIPLTAGDRIGTLGAKYVAALDVGVYKQGYQDPGFTQTKYYHSVDAVCPLDLFAPAVRDVMYGLVKRTSQPRCGQIGQDKANALQGTWYSLQDPDKAKTDWNSHFTLAHDSGDPTIGIVAVAGKISNPSKYFFTPTHTGIINREPSETVTGTVYCYQHDNNQLRNDQSHNGKVLLKISNNNTMQAQHQDGTCQANEILSSPTTYYR